jgi:hypothetical protein
MRRFQIPAACALPDTFARGKLLTGFDIYLALDYTAFALIVLPCAQKIRFAIVKQKRGVNPALIDKNRLRPFRIYIVSPDIKVLLRACIGSGHIKTPLIITDSGRKHPARAVNLVQHNLAFAGKAMPYRLPIDKILALKQRHGGKILKRAAHKIILIARPAYARVGIKTFDYGIMVSHLFLLYDFFLLEFIFGFIYWVLFRL